MFQLIKELFSLLTPNQRRRFYTLQVLVVLMAFAEIAGVAAIGPFMLLVADMAALEGEGRLAQLYQASGFSSPDDFVFWAGVAVLGVLAVGSCLSIFTTWRLALFSNQIGAEISSRLFRFYMHQPWLFHSSHSSSGLTKNIATEAGRITNQVLGPLMQMNARIALAFFMSLTVFLFNPVVALCGIALFGLAYLLLFKLVRHKISRHGKRISQQNGARFRLMSEGFGGIKDVLLLNRQPMFITQFASSSQQLARSQATNQTLSGAPRYMMELIAFGAMIFLVLYLLYSHQGNMSGILPSLAVYGLAGFKLMPAFQNIYQQLTQIRGGLPAYQAVKADLANSHIEHNIAKPHTSAPAMRLHDGIHIQQLHFCYPGKHAPAICDLTLTIPANSVVGIVGASGSGKSTLIDLLLGLLEPDQGQILLDSKPLNNSNRRAWQEALGFVPQSIFLADASLTANIAFGLPANEIDLDKINKAAHLAHLDEVIAQLPHGLDTLVGERGVQLSGGQRQRIGIARALYHDASVLILDEATSALDGITEKLIMDAIHDFTGQKTIIMIAHRLKTVQACDIIFYMQDGRLVDHGRFDELRERNPEFARMALYA